MKIRTLVKQATHVVTIVSLLLSALQPIVATAGSAQPFSTYKDSFEHIKTIPSDSFISSEKNKTWLLDGSRACQVDRKRIHSCGFIGGWELSAIQKGKLSGHDVAIVPWNGGGTGGIMALAVFTSKQPVHLISMTTGEKLIFQLQDGKLYAETSLGYGAAAPRRLDAYGIVNNHLVKLRQSLVSAQVVSDATIVNAIHAPLISHVRTINEKCQGEAMNGLVVVSSRWAVANVGKNCSDVITDLILAHRVGSSWKFVHRGKFYFDNDFVQYGVPLPVAIALLKGQAKLESLLP